MKSLALSAALATSVTALRIAQINDIHVSLDYNFSCGFGLCLDMGNYLADPPIKLLDYVLSDISDYGGHIDAISIAGDFVVHGLCNSDPNHANWPKMKDVLQAITASIRK